MSGTEENHAPNRPWIYTASTRARWILSIISLLLIALSLWVLSLGFTGEFGLLSPDPRMGIILTALLLGGGMTLLFAACLVSVFRSRFEMFPDRIRQRKLFRFREVMYSQITGYRIIGGGWFPNLYLELKGGKNYMFELAYENRHEIIYWASCNFTDLSAAAHEEEHNQLVSDPALGSDETERLRNLQRGHRLTKWLNGAAYIIFAWVAFAPFPMPWPLWAAMTLPLVALAVIPLSGGVISFDGATDARPISCVAFIFPALGLMLRAALDWTIYDWSGLWLPFALFSVLYFALVMLVDSGERQSMSVIASLLFCIVLGYGTTFAVNGTFGNKEPVLYEGTVQEKRIADISGKRFLRLKQTSGDAENEFPVHESFFNSVETGDEVKVKLYPGALGIPWLTAE